jgi:hypothetical protein
MENDNSTDHRGPFAWVVFSMKKLKHGAGKLVPKFLLTGDGQVSAALERFYSPFLRITAINH